MLSLLPGIGYVRKRHSFSPVSAGLPRGYLKETATENVKKKNEDITVTSQRIRFFSCPLLLKKYLWQLNIKGIYLKVISRKYLQGHRSVSLIFHHTCINGTMRVCILNSGIWTAKKVEPTFKVRNRTHLNCWFECSFKLRMGIIKIYDF